ncbi:MAG: bifunctional 4-hydroxy-2-oxoglutarate aldolase/2-dehydro-3-deoxy-phosphogluconate aldolase [Clostridiales bacterium]|jgi:2-dehydro-3-deoxyphosphogluconate aldolase/(4S)-4-hydroxy-2-oxoglutarate aldolase|nr:bifunctional 4-hydroxy-2-oxoglutarate aldolase/2-dehydro-3-deoxy-phosphogluconate aldolase [Clostridiales bacterium]
MNSIEERIFNSGVVPVIKIAEEKDAAPLAAALGAGGLDVLEITFRTEAAEAAIRNVAKSHPDMLLGAGTVSNVETVKKALDAGASFIVSPGFNPSVVDYCVKNSVYVVPGVGGATDIEAALSYGLKTVKFFPAEANGGVKALKAISAPYGDVRFMPTGGIDASNLASYLSFDKVIACGGSWIAKEDLIKANNFTEITRLAREAVALIHGFSFAHLGINSEDEGLAGEFADAFTDLFFVKQRDIGVSIFITDFIEVMKKPGFGRFGHIGINTLNVKRAIAYFEKRGVALDYDTLRLKNGEPSFIYLKEPVGAFMVHLKSY